MSHLIVFVWKGFYNNMNKWGRKNSKILFSTVTNGSFQMEMPLDSTSVN